MAIVVCAIRDDTANLPVFAARLSLDDLVGAREQIGLSHLRQIRLAPTQTDVRDLPR